MEVKCKSLDDSLSVEQDSSVTLETYIKQEVMDEHDAEVCQCFYFVVQCFA